MKVRLKISDIRKALELGCHVIEKKSPSPVLSNIKLEAQKLSANSGDENCLMLTSTDMFVSLESSVPARVVEEGPITVPARTLYDIVRKLPDDVEIELTSDESSNVVTIKLPSSVFSLPTLPPDEFPSLESNDNYQIFPVNASILLSLFERTRHAISNEEIRYYLNGVYLHTSVEGDDKYLIAVATDGHRLAKIKALVTNEIPDIEGVIVHKKTISEVIKLLEDTAGDITFGISSNKIMFKNDNHTIISKVVDGKFPDYSKAIPQNNDKALIASLPDLANAIDLVTSVSYDKNKMVKFDIVDSKITLTTSSEFDGARGNRTIDADYSAEPISFGFNARYVLDVLNVLDGDKIRLSFSDGMTAVVCENPDDSSFLAILMPMQI